MPPLPPSSFVQLVRCSSAAGSPRRAEREKRVTRPLFDATGRTEKQRIYALIDQAPRGTVFYKMMVNPDPNAAAKELVVAANAAGGEDNTSVIVVKIS